MKPRFSCKLSLCLTLGFIIYYGCFVNLAVGQDEEIPEIIPTELRDISIGISKSDLMSQRPNVKKWFAPQGEEKAYFEQLPEDKFFSDVVYGILDEKVSFIVLNGPRDWMETGKVKSLLPYLIKGCLNKYGEVLTDRGVIEHRIATKAGTKTGIKSYKALMVWKKDDIEIALLIPTPTSLATMEQVNDLGLAKYRLVMIGKNSKVGETFLEPENRNNDPDLLQLVFDDLPIK